MSIIYEPILLKIMLVNVEQYLIISLKHYASKLIDISGTISPSFILYIGRSAYMDIGFGASVVKTKNKKQKHLRGAASKTKYLGSNDSAPTWPLVTVLLKTRSSWSAVSSVPNARPRDPPPLSSSSTLILATTLSFSLQYNQFKN